MAAGVIAVSAAHGVGPWLELGEAEDQLGLVRPAAFRTTVPASLLPFYGLLADEFGYRTEAEPAGGWVRLVLLRRGCGRPARGGWVRRETGWPSAFEPARRGDVSGEHRCLHRSTTPPTRRGPPEIAARTVSKERVRSEEATQRSSTSTRDISPGRRGALRSHRGAGGRTRDQRCPQAPHRGTRGRSTMSMAQRERVLGR